MAYRQDIHMMTSSNETFSALLAFCAGYLLVPGEFPPHKGQWSVPE